MEKRIIEIGGTKVEVDLRYAKTIDCYQIGDPIKVLVKEYSETYVSYVGVIVSLDNFANRPALNILYIKNGYDNGIKLATLTIDSKDIEICPLIDKDEILVLRREIVASLDDKIKSAKATLQKAEEDKRIFTERLAGFFKETVEEQS